VIDPRARDLLLEHGWNTTCWQILNPGIELWFSARGDAVVGFVRAGRTCVVAGAPVCAQDRLPDVVLEWEAQAKRVCYFGAESRLQGLMGDNPAHSSVSLGAQPLWSPASWIEAIDRDASLRYQLNRARNKGVTVSEWDADRARANPDLERCLTEWLAHRGLPSMHFLVEPQTLDAPEERRFFVAERKGKVEAFVTMAPIPQRQGWLTEQFPRAHGAPNGSVELALDAAVRAVGNQGAEMMTMGIVPLSRHGELAAQSNPFWLRFLSHWARAHGRRFYNFEGLDQFKTKFHPDEWEPIHVIAKEPRFSFRSLYAVAAAFTGGSPATTLARALGKAVKTEVHNLARKAKR
jgi:phosphatidylglycerol lysyltransferase